eukprot:scaffold421198_cov41-Attheya_sp.AAC.1
MELKGSPEGVTMGVQVSSDLRTCVGNKLDQAVGIKLGLLLGDDLYGSNSRRNSRISRRRPHGCPTS